ncbi:Futalosine hydrolase [Paenibacillus sp. CECT 9249]|uniref:futalosine hydrolase n=1 Tax=Paenibacillus sp. CECT 9249 TaxID=2845385 RepID=UPI001E5A3A6F|nr:futalosine hydrolase [Paenibacillus sp. CECT 9249]CAH0120158.1 Futalosine hydrolase [Paenibacillus sp. CECT 9249]
MSSSPNISTSFAQREKEGRILIMTSVEAERAAVMRGLQGDGRFDVLLSGVGAAVAAARTAKALGASAGEDGKPGYGLVVNAGIAGGYAGQAKIGDIVLASLIIAADLGAESPERFLSVDELGFGSARLPVDDGLAGRIVASLQQAGLPVRSGPILTVSTTTGTAATAAELAARVPGATAEAMEGYGVAAAALEFGLPILELRAVSNAVGPRDRSAWRIKEALNALEAASSILPEVLSS